MQKKMLENKWKREALQCTADEKYTQKKQQQENENGEERKKKCFQEIIEDILCARLSFSPSASPQMVKVFDRASNVSTSFNSTLFYNHFCACFRV